jgi:hypothetical protein
MSGTFLLGHPVYVYIYLLTAVGLTPGGSSTVSGSSTVGGSSIVSGSSTSTYVAAVQ